MKRLNSFIAEISTGKLVDYVAKASQDVGRRIEKAEPGEKPFKKIMARSGKIGRAMAHVKTRTNEQADMCTVCGQTPCNCTHIEEGAELNRGPQRPSRYTDPRIDYEMKATKKEYEHRAKHFAADKAGDKPTAEKERKRMFKFQSIGAKSRAERSKGHNYGDAIAKDYKDQEKKRGIGHVRDHVEIDGTPIVELTGFKAFTESLGEEAKPHEIHVSPAKNGQYKVHAVGSKFAHGVKVGEHLNDTHLDDFSEMGGKIKMVKAKKD